MNLQTWDMLVKPYLQGAQYEAQEALRHVHKAGRLIAEILERPDFKTKAEAELEAVEAALEAALTDVRRVQAAYQEKRIEAPSMQQQAAE